jgi:hypothetical protein
MEGAEKAKGILETVYMFSQQDQPILRVPLGR